MDSTTNQVLYSGIGIILMKSSIILSRKHAISKWEKLSIKFELLARFVM